MHSLEFNQDMIFGIGTDIVQISRIQDALDRRLGRFAMKILGPQEQSVYVVRSAASPAKGVRYLATRFAAKEALSKAMGTGFRAPLSWHGVQLLNAENGRPIFVFSNKLNAWFVERQLTTHVTISDELEYALSFVVIEANLPTCQK